MWLYLAALTDSAAMKQKTFCVGGAPQAEEDWVLAFVKLHVSLVGSQDNRPSETGKEGIAVWL